MKLAHKLTLPPALCAAVAVICVVVFVVAGRQQLARSQANAEAGQAQQQQLAQVRTRLVQARGEVFRTLALMSSMDDAAVAQARKALAQQINGLGQNIEQVGKANAGDATVRDLVAATPPLLQTYLRQWDKAIDLSGTDPNIGIGAMKAAEDTFAGLAKALDAIAARSDALVDERNAADERRAALVMLVLAAVAIGTTLGAIAFGWRLQRRIVGQVAHAAHVGHEVAAGNLLVEMRVQGDDEIAELQHSLADMVGGLRQSLATVQGATQHIGSAAQEIHGGAQALSDRTLQTAAALQQAAGSMGHLSNRVNHTADSARTASELAAHAVGVAQRGGEVVAQVVSTMGEIDASSRRIGQIIGTIDGIAFQTNILALNAAVEAARAGEQGRGFAVVASEVRSLAQRAAEAAREIKVLVGGSVEKVDAGSRLVNDAGQTMGELVADVQRVSQLIAEISTAAAEQSTGILEVNQSVSQLDAATEQNADMVRRSASAASDLEQQARRLSDVVARFRLGEAVGPVAAAGHFDAHASAPTSAPTSALASLPSSPPSGAAAHGPAHAPVAGSVPRQPADVPAKAGKVVSTPAAPRASSRAKAAAPAPAAVATAGDDDWQSF